MDKEAIIARAKEEYQEFKKKYPYEGSTWTKGLVELIYSALEKDEDVLDFTDAFDFDYININYKSLTLSFYEKRNGQIWLSDYVDIWDDENNRVLECFKM